MLSELRFGSLLTYSPRGESTTSSTSRGVCYSVKAGDPRTLQLVGQRLREHIDSNGVLAPFFDSSVTLVPMPRSTPLVEGALWPTQEICRALISAGIARHNNPVLQRVRAVARSSQAPRGERPNVAAHYDSLVAQRRIDVSDRIVLVDDVVTLGRTAIAAASHLSETYPKSVVMLFAVIRTKGMIPDIERILEPVAGLIRSHGNDAEREP